MNKAEGQISVSSPSELSFADEALSPSTASSCHLSVSIESESISFAVLKPGDKEYLAAGIQPLPREAGSSTVNSSLFAHPDILAWEYKSVSISVNSYKSTLLPSSLYKEKNQRDYLTLNCNVTEKEDVLHDFLPTLEGWNIYAVPQSLVEQITDAFPKATLINSSSVVIESMMINHKHSHKFIINLDFHASHFELVILKKGKLLFHNHFPYKAPEDVAYYALYTLEQLELSADNTEARITGSIQPEDAIFSLLTKYIPRISFDKRPENFNYSKALEQLPAHQFYHLFNQYLI